MQYVCSMYASVCMQYVCISMYAVCMMYAPLSFFLYINSLSHSAGSQARNPRPALHAFSSDVPRPALHGFLPMSLMHA